MKIKVTEASTVWAILWFNWLVVDIIGSNMITMFVLALVSSIVIRNKSEIIRIDKKKA